MKMQRNCLANLFIGLFLCAVHNDLSNLTEDMFICLRIVAETIEEVVPGLISHNSNVDIVRQ
jgi:hypothetical protein